MRNRGRDGEIQASTYQYHPRHLLYHENPEQGWHAGVLADAHKRLKQHIPKHLQASFKLLWHGCPREQEDSTLPAARWINTHGTRLGFRVPNAGERARATGRGAYLSSLKLTEAQLYDLVGNHFDPDALILRIGPLLRAWARGACPPSITTPHPHTYSIFTARSERKSLALVFPPLTTLPSLATSTPFCWLATSTRNRQPTLLG